jgi:hypothetical protein
MVSHGLAKTLQCMPCCLTSTLARLQLHQAAAERFRLAQLEANLSVRVQTKRQRRLRGHGIISVLQHLCSSSD